ncbi:MAG: 4-(cytidine 5'-diphospho)-2-C-methyl-D-erythritol kinase [Ruminococcaceae bacterium]|nr:4-(cytidine 5'-diphospho)-2-C-methyl-D-erythritol kinase [Oscillospiraceae bacterium]
MSEYNIKANAKINLSLDIVSKRENGYHNLKMIMHTVNLCDDIILSENSAGEYSLKTNLKYLPNDGRNILYKAYKAFYDEVKIKPQGFSVNLIKRIPVCAGLGGGSSDAAAELLFLNKYHNNPLDIPSLLKVGERVGADVPFCIMGGTCLAEGTGEILTPLPPLPECPIIILKPQNKGLSTKDIFSKVNIGEIKYHPDTDGIIKALNEGDLSGIAKRMYNVLEDYSVPESPDIEEFKQALIMEGAIGSLMSGSGNAVFGLFNDTETAKKALKSLKKLTPLAYLV